MKLIRQVAAALLPLSMLAAPAFAQQASGVVISQFAVRGPVGGNDEFVEIYNASSAPVSIGGWTLQGCQNGTPGTPSVRATVPAGTTLLPGRYYLFANTVAPTTTSYSLGVAPDSTYTVGVTDFSTAGFSGIRIVPSNSTALTGVAVDGVGSGASPCREGTGIVTPTANGINTAFLRSTVGGVVQDANNNATDFPAAGPGAPRNSLSPANGGGGGGLPSVSLSVTPASFSEGGGSASVTATLSAAYTSPVTVNVVFGGSATINTDYTASTTTLTIPTGATSASLTVSAIEDAVFEGDETVIASLGTLSGATAGTPNTVTATILDNDPSPPPQVGTRIYQIQGAQHRSPMVGQTVTNVPGIVTARAGNGFYMQDGDGDGIDATSDGIFVFTSTAPPAAASVGSQVLVSGTVQENRPGNDADNLTVTQIGVPTVTPYVGNALFLNTVITPTVLGNGGRIPPADIIDNDSLGNVETSLTTQFDPAQDGLDFHESLEGMLVRINGTRATGPRNNFGEVWVVGDLGANATGANARGGITLVERSTGVDYNPERIQLDDGLNGVVMPQGVNTGDFLGDVTGVATYSFGNYEVLLTATPTLTSNPLPTGVRTIAFGGDRLSVGAYNVENLDPGDTTFTAFGQQIANALGAPDILALSEVQDNNGATNNGIVSASQTIQLLIDAIVAAGGPRYSFVTVDPVNNQDGGEPGGNIRLVQFYNPLRVSFVPGTAGAGGSLDATAPTLVNGRVALTLSPGRISPTNTAFNSSRKPLAATYDFNGRRVVIVNNHFNSKGGDEPLLGVNQPPNLSSEAQRINQATLVNNFVSSVQSLDPAARVIVLGDLNDFDFSPPLRILRTGVNGTLDTLRNLGTELIADPAERYSYTFEGNAQELDHILATPSLLAANAQYEAIRLNAEYAVQLSDHEPLLSSYLLPANVAPTAVAVAVPAVAIGGQTVTLDGTGSTDSDGTIASYAWVQSGGPTISLLNADTATASFVAPAVREAITVTFTLTVTDNEQATGVATVSVRINPANRPPVAVDDVLTLDQDTSATVDVLANDTDGDGDTLTISEVGAPGFGTAVIDGSLIRYTPNAGFSGNDAFTYSIVDGRGGSATASVAVTVNDTVPNAFAFTAVVNAERNTLTTSNTITVGGITAPTSISIANGSYSVNGGAFVSAAGTVSNGDTVAVKVLSASNFANTTTATLSIGGVSAAFNVTTRNANTFPTPFSFPPVTNAPRNTLIVSQSIVVTGIEAPASISIAGGEFSVNGGTFTSFVGGVVNNGDSVRVRVLSPAQFTSAVNAVLTIDAFSANFSVATEAEDTVPNAFSFAPRTGVLRNTVQTSDAITVAGINSPAAISVTGGSYSINGGPFVTTPGTVSNGASVVVRQTSSRRFNTTTTTTLTIGGVSGSFNVTTRRLFAGFGGQGGEADIELAPGLLDRYPVLQR